MIPPIDAAAQQFLNGIDRIQSNLNRAQRQLSSGLRVSAPSDAPGEVSAILELQAGIQQNQQTRTNLGNVKAETDAGEQALSAAVDLLQQASVIASQGTGASQTNSTRAELAAQVQDIMDQMNRLSATTANGRLVFSDPTRLIEGPDGARFSVSLDASQVFDHQDSLGNADSDNVYLALTNLKSALLSGDVPGMEGSVSTLQKVSTYMNDQLASYGNIQNRIASALSAAQKRDTSLQTELGVKQDADAAQAILALNQGQVQLQAAMAAQAKAPPRSLFELL
jgi:flagellar hook-associated protein 3 FlgL